MKFGLKESELKVIIDYLKNFKEVQKVVIFGSRARGDYKEYSDIDLCVFTLNSATRIELPSKEELDNLRVPYLFDLAIWNQITNEKFKDRILRDGVVIWEK